jgi:EAL domain-containing protein (putative c-di-GMP-specific phosphodiesterase class I)
MEQLDVLRKLDCDRIQGFLLARGLPAAEFETLARAREHHLTLA